MSINLHFPNLALLPRCEKILDDPFDWEDPNLLILNTFWDIQISLQSNLPEFFELTHALFRDLRIAREGASNQQIIDTIDCALFITCSPAIHVTRAAGQLGACYDWVWASVSHIHQIDGNRTQENIINFLQVSNLSPEFYSFYMNCLPTFIEGAFYLAYRFGGLDQLTGLIAGDCWNVLALLRQVPDSRDDTLAINQMVTWAGHRNHPDGQSWADDLMDLYERSNNPHQRKYLAMTFITPAFSFTDQTPIEWAERIFHEHYNDLVEEERIQVMGIIISDAVTWNLHKNTILAEIEHIREKYSRLLQPGHSLLEVLELRISILHPLFYTMVNFANPAEIIEVLHAWYGEPKIESYDDDTLIVIPTHKGGAAYIWPEGRWITGTENYDTLNTMQRAIGPAIGSYLRGTDGDRDPAEFVDFRFDIPNVAHGHAMEQTMEAHYRLSELQQMIPKDWHPKSIIVFPAGPEPLQALFLKTLGLSAPLESSLQHLNALRPIRQINVWMGEILNGQFELEAIRLVADRAEWYLKVFQTEAPTVEEFRVFYEDPGADILWVISHGEHNPFMVEGTNLHVGGTTYVTLEQLRNFSVPGKDRRLIVLNSCSSAATQLRGGLGRIGIAQSLASCKQSVVGNLWPITPSAALTYGAILAAQLQHTDPVVAALQGLKFLQNPNELRARFNEAYSENPELLQQLMKASDRLEGITDWGCPVLVV